MHEVSLILNLLDIVEEEVRKAGGGKVTTLFLKVGKLSGAEPELLKNAFEVVKRGTLVEGASLKMEIVDPLVRCRNCGNEFSPDDFIFICPQCGSTETELLKGEELILERIEVEGES